MPGSWLSFSFLFPATPERENKRVENIVEEEVMWGQAGSDSFEESSQFCTLKHIISSQVQMNYSSLTLSFIRTQRKEQMLFPSDLASRAGVTQKRYKPVSGKGCYSKSGLRFNRDLFAL